MLQVIFRIPGLNIPIYGYGLMLVLGFLLALQLAKFLANRAGLDPEVFANAALLALVAGVAGARLSHVLENLPQYTDSNRSLWANFYDAINIRNGGLTYYGGFLLAGPTLIWYAWRKGLPLRLSMDIVAPCLMIGLGVGRVGCYLNGCCYGAEAPWGVRFPYGSNAYQDQFQKGEIKVGDVPQELLVDDGEHVQLKKSEEVRKDPLLAQVAQTQRARPVIPAQLFSTFAALLLAAILYCYYTLPHRLGRVFALMLMLEGTSRFLLEMVRAEPPVFPPLFGSLSLSMVLSLFLVPIGILLWFVFGKLDPASRGEVMGSPQIA